MKNIKAGLVSLLHAGLSKGAAFALFFLFVVAVVQATATIITFVEDVKGKSAIYQAAKWGLLVCNLAALLDGWLTRAVKWAILSQWPDTRTLLQAYLGLVGVIFCKIFASCMAWLIKEPLTKP